MTHPKTYGPTRTPASICPATIESFSLAKIRLKTSAKIARTARSSKKAACDEDAAVEANVNRRMFPVIWLIGMVAFSAIAVSVLSFIVFAAVLYFITREEM